MVCKHCGVVALRTNGSRRAFGASVISMRKTMQETEFIFVDPDGLIHEIIWLEGVAFVRRCDEALPIGGRKGRKHEFTTCLQCLGQRADVAR